MKLFLKTLWRLILVALLTLLTQIGGLLYLLCLPLFALIDNKLMAIKRKGWIKFGSFFSIYLIFTLFIIPPLSNSLSKRVPMPWYSQHVRPLNLGYALLNRHYVSPKLKKIVMDNGQKMAKNYPGSITAYMDAGFPFKDGYPLLPHLSHDDGEKIDLAFFYKDKKSGEEVNRKTPTAVGYGSELPVKKGEWNQAQKCLEKGYWQYGWMAKNLPNVPFRNLEFDIKRNKSFVRYFAKDPRVGKVLIEPHVKSRLGLGNYNKLRWAGCKAVRHDDHIHVQL